MSKKYPSWKYRYFRLRYVDHYGNDTHLWGIEYSSTGIRSDLSTPGIPQIGIWLGPRLAVFDLTWRKNVKPKI